MLYSVVVGTTSEGISVSNSITDFEPALFFSASKTDNNFPPTPSATQIKENTGNVLQSTYKFWNTKVQQLTKHKKKNQTNKNIKSQENAQEIEQLRQTEISNITAPKSSIFSRPLLQHFGQHARLRIRNTLHIPGIQHLAKILAHHYHWMGYPLCCFSEATLTLDGKCQIRTQEPRYFEEPMIIAFAKEMLVYNDGMRIQYRLVNIRNIWKQSNLVVSKETEFNTLPLYPSKKEHLKITYVQTSGKTQSDAIAKAIGLTKKDTFNGIHKNGKLW